MERREFLKAAGVTLAGVGLPAVQATETLADYDSHRADGRSLTVTSAAGQRLRITAYGGQIVRVRAVRAGEEFFADDRYEFVDPVNHAGMGGTLTVTDLGDRLVADAGPRVVIMKNPLRVSFHDGDTRFAGEDATHSLTWDGGVVRQSFAAPAAGERFVKGGHGFFGRSPRVDRTGETVAHNYGTRSNPVDQAPAVVQLYLSSRGYAVFVNTSFDTTFHFGNGDAYGFDTGAPQLDYFVIRGPRFAQLLDNYTALTGRPRMPRLGVFGLQLSDKNFPSTSDQNWWTSRITTLRNAGFPLDVQVHDNRWREGSGAWSGSWFEFSRARWPDPAAFKRWADEQGILTVLDYNRNNSNEMAGWSPAYSFRPEDLTAVPHNDAVPDWTNPATGAWAWNVFWTKALDPALGFPGDGLWIDEPDDLGSIALSAPAANGWRWSELRNAYFLHLHRGVVATGWDRALPQKRPWVFTRGASAGQQRWGHLWTGDTQSTYGEMREQIRGMLNAGLGGFPYANIDAGGFFGKVLPGDLYRNWVAAWASMSPIWRPHSDGNVDNDGIRASRWPIDQDAAERDEFLRYARLRYTLLPYIYTIARQAHASGMPMARAMVIDHQDTPMAYAHDLQYMWGPSILAAPVTTDVDGAVQNVWLPAGETWYNFWSEARSAGSDTAEKAYVTRTGEIILFVKAGAILPRYRYAQSTAFLDKSHLELDVYTGKDGVFDLFEDDGVTTATASAVTPLAFDQAAMAVSIGRPASTYPGAPAARRYVVRLHGLSAPVDMRQDQPLPAFSSETAAVLHGSGQYWDAARSTLSVVTPVTAGAVTLRPSGRPFPPVTGPAVYPAEDAVRSGVTIGTQHRGYTGHGYADYANATGDYLEWTVTINTAGPHTLSFRYANGAATSRPLTVSATGAPLDLPPTGAWTTWSTASLTAMLPAGRVTIRATAAGASGPNIDCLTISAPGR
ncbi:TIM-barrel domain-containing protein [Catenuloplanes japonicus]|uniref:TIM-barrel domain-containing protein n=1 Tax=Catenuloplanes japonicus TaxID=33876 RepID=UPI000690653C|nr:TIM-barrel domain-containing protein [Catenuloplanes japonicus]